MREGGKKLRRLGLAAVFMLAASAAAAQAQNCHRPAKSALRCPAALDDGWPTASPESAGLDSARLCGIAARLQDTEPTFTPW